MGHFHLDGLLVPSITQDYLFLLHSSRVNWRQLLMVGITLTGIVPFHFLRRKTSVLASMSWLRWASTLYVLTLCSCFLSFTLTGNPAGVQFILSRSCGNGTTRFSLIPELLFRMQRVSILRGWRLPANGRCSILNYRLRFTRFTTSRSASYPPDVNVCSLCIYVLFSWCVLSYTIRLSRPSPRK